MSGTRKPLKKATGRLGTQLRGKLQDDYAGRGKSKYRLWYAYSSKAQADVLLHGDPRYFHFLLVESDPDVKTANYNVQARAMQIAGEELGQIVDAELHMADNSVVWRCVRAEETSSVATKVDHLHLLVGQRVHRDLPSRVEVLTAAEITSNPMRIQNWNRLLPYLGQARAWPLNEFGNEVATLIHTRDEVALCDVVALAEPGREALYVAALLQGVQVGRYLSNLNEKPWGLGSRFWGARR
ncbi:hypothetical protein G8A07_14370 [Roseateles sp. DAIF2]|uniref:hypothetical protein n=1 Tax=Roseateles sp. DAIF2 TaxID=2714952 RepID=UPI0018A31416|nr:hypothetical protein [Roseateles sp. DAIF2]QPF73983.1 hypothetical protein G8A07_14370 [Roseateles sp. DAIF2]